MNKKKKKLSKKQMKNRIMKMSTSLRALLMIVAIIECVMMIAFSTYSWIETNSSLIIKNGPAFNDIDHDTDDVTSLEIASKLKYKVNLTTSNDESWAELNDYFSSVKFFEFAKTTTPNGKTFFFPRSNNTYDNATAFRPGDTIDYNTSYLYFDFVLSNSTTENFNVYFDNTFDENIFTVTGGNFSSDSETNEAYKNALRRAMRMSITTKAGNASEQTTIYAYNGDSTDAVTYTTIAPTGANLQDPTMDYQVTANSIKKSVYATTNNVITSEKLFVARKNVDTRVSIRVWFELRDPTFEHQFGFDNNQNSYTTDEFKKISSAQIGVKFRLKTSLNDLRALNFDDYTFSTQQGATHLTDEEDGYSVWFVAFQPAVAAAGARPERAAQMTAIQLQRDATNANFTRWSTPQTTDSMMNWLMGADIYSTTASNDSAHSGYSENTVANRYTKCFFCYGDFATKTAKYCWQLTAAPAVDNGEYIYNAYSLQPSSSTSTVIRNPQNNSDILRTGTFKSGVGIWEDDTDYTTMSLLQVNDMTTGFTTGNYNASVSGSPNEKFMAAKATGNSGYVLYANNIDGFTGNNQAVNIGNSTTTTIHASGNIGAITAAMYYDSDEELFKSYVPTYWVTGDDNNASYKGVSVSYVPGGTFNQSNTAMRWYSSSPQHTGNSNYTYTALGYTKTYNDNSYLTESAVGNSTVYTGVGTWGEVEKLSFSTELIDSDLNAAYKYAIGINSYSDSGQTWDYYAMVPDETNMTFYAYVPKDIGKESAEISFARYASYSTHTIGPCWFANVRGSYKTFYPVSLGGVYAEPSLTKYKRGYWNVSVLVDGTYENLIYDTLTDGNGNTYAPLVSGNTLDYTPRNNYGKLEYSYTGQDNTWITVCDDTQNLTLDLQNGGMIDRYRFYAPAENHATVYWRWTPYAGYTVTVTPAQGDPETTEYDETVFNYVHNTSTGIYKLITEAPNTVEEQQQQSQQNSPQISGRIRRIDVETGSSTESPEDVREPEQTTEAEDAEDEEDAEATEPDYSVDMTENTDETNENTEY